MSKTLIGAHVSFLKHEQFEGSINDLLKMSASSGAFYISDSRSYKKSYDISEELTNKGKEIASTNNFNIENIIVHAPLVGNIANTEAEKQTYKLTVESYLKDVKRMEDIGLKLYNFHPGSSKDRELGFKKISDAINEIHSKTNNVILLIETMMKKGNFLGVNFEEIRTIIDKVDDKSRIGVTFDTCHLWDAGYDLSDFDKILDEFDSIVGIDYLKAMHINDSKNELGSNKDRHELIGHGFIGLDNLKRIVNNPRVIDIPKALETPYKEDNINKWAQEIIILTK